MSEPVDSEFKLVLVRAFDQGLSQYCGSGSADRLPPGVAQAELAKCLVEMARNGLRKQDDLATGDFFHLIALTMKPR